MSCAICLESYVNSSKPGPAERVPFYFLLSDSPATVLSNAEETTGCFPSLFRSRPSQSTVGQRQNRSASADTVIVATKCGHIFHRGCVKRWFQHSKKSTCPVCRVTNRMDELRKLYMDPTPVIFNETHGGMMVSMSLSQYNKVEDGFKEDQAKLKEAYEAALKAAKESNARQEERSAARIQELEGQVEKLTKRLK